MSPTGNTLRSSRLKYDPVCPGCKRTMRLVGRENQPEVSEGGDSNLRMRMRAAFNLHDRPVKEVVSGGALS